MAQTRKEIIDSNVCDLVGELLYYGRKEDEDLPVGAIEQAISEGEITEDEIVSIFKTALIEGLK